MVKPDGVQRGLIGKILQRVEEKGFKIVAMKLVQMPEEKAKEHYAEHVGKKFYQDLVDFITSGPSVCLVVEGRGSIAAMRKMNGATNPVDAVPGTIRGTGALRLGGMWCMVRTPRHQHLARSHFTSIPLSWLNTIE